MWATAQYRRTHTHGPHEIDEGRLDAAALRQLGEGGVGHAEIFGAQCAQHLRALRAACEAGRSACLRPQLMRHEVIMARSLSADVLGLSCGLRCSVAYSQSDNDITFSRRALRHCRLRHASETCESQLS